VISHRYSGIKDDDLDKDCLKMEDFQGQQIQYGGDEAAVKKIWGDRYIRLTSGLKSTGDSC